MQSSVCHALNAGLPEPAVQGVCGKRVSHVMLYLCHVLCGAQSAIAHMQDR